ncbi:MAG: hypothetical protein HY527_00230 [Betaproteobacteria bacterium]|nr:hypothetical protein [Betaproteobacteria bacterium]
MTAVRPPRILVPVTRCVARGTHDGACPAPAFRGIRHRLQRRHAVLAVRVRHGDAHRAQIEQLLDQREIDLGHAHERRDAGGIRSPDEMSAAVEIEGTVLHVDDDEIDPCGGHHLDHHRTPGEKNHAGENFAAGERAPDPVFH